MRIKRVEIIGFKSFCDRAVINLDSSITAVVGPNGCGKSNIVDAIRWCMGEQSAKHLRGKAMEDVIFAGSESRGPAPMAEMSLTFDEVGFSNDTLEVARIEGADEVDAFDEGEEPQLAEGGEASADAQGGDGGQSAPAQATPEVFEDWADPDAPGLDFARFSEVTITRRLYRDGSSHYLINKTACRLRDVTDFFLGTGVGTKAYSIIEQGRIGQIVSSRPQDRRSIIEEAAGITKFKSRKKAAEKKLDQTKQNLLRVSDIVSELDKRMGALRRQAQKAERFRSYKGELRELELWKAAHRCLELRADEGVAARRLATIGEELTAARSGVADHETAIAELREALQAADHELAHATEQVLALDGAIALAASKREFAVREREELVARNQQALDERGGVEAALAQCTQDERQLAAQLEATRGEHDVAVARKTQHQHEVSQLRAEVARLEPMLASARERVFATRREQASLLASIEGYQGRREELAARRERLGTQHGGLADEASQLAAELAACEREVASRRQTRLALGERESDFSGKLEGLGDQVMQLEAEIETVRTEAHRRRSRLQSLEEIQQKLEGYASGTRAIMHRMGGQPGVLGLVADSVKVPAMLEAAVEAVFGAHVEGVIVRDLPSGVSAAGYLKQQGAGRSTFVPVAGLAAAASGDMMTATSVAHGIVVEDRSADVAALAQVGTAGIVGELAQLVEFAPDIAAIATRMTSPYLVVDSLDRAISLRTAGMLRPLVTLDGDVVDEHGVIRGGSRDASEVGVLAQKREMRELAELTEQLDQQLSSKSMALVSVRGERKQLQLAVEALRAQTHAEELAVMGYEKDLGRLRADCEAKRGLQTRLSLELAELVDMLARGDAELVEHQQRMAAATLELDAAQLEAVSTEEAIASQRIQLETAQVSETDAKVLHAMLAEKLTALQAGVARIAQQVGELQHRQQRLVEALSQYQQRVAQVEAQEVELTDELARANGERSVRGADVEGLRVRNEAQHAAVAMQDVACRSLRSIAEALASERAELELRRSSAQMNQQVLGDAMLERYQLQLEDVLFDYHLRPHMTTDQEARIGDLRELLERMGTDINLLAIDEYNEVAERFEFLSSQRDDLETAVSQLERAIDRMNKTSRKLFKETFQQINNTFKEVFPRLFRGGQASLSLTGGEHTDLLEAGVEIMAQPPGKKNATVDQLSGGEKALTAVALVFSIFLIKPSPFCILDEVDAPLDEANVDRYNEIVREMTDRSQFIIITHNKRTMETADNLYGVTMQEAGVSKLVTVNLQRLGAQAASAI
ncbi:MAG: chromosome segregation protein SMC [Myxococcales bacterium]|nr:chromosome segregation protein SMC [Myxococcales bacterium]